MAKQQLTKAQISKEVRRVLLQYGASLTDVFFSAGVSSIFLNGNLIKCDGRDFSHEEMMSLTFDLLKIGQIRCELENWNIGQDGVYYVGDYDKYDAS